MAKTESRKRSSKNKSDKTTPTKESLIALLAALIALLTAIVDLIVSLKQ